MTTVEICSAIFLSTAQCALGWSSAPSASAKTEIRPAPPLSNLPQPRRPQHPVNPPCKVTASNNGAPFCRPTKPRTPFHHSKIRDASRTRYPCALPHPIWLAASVTGTDRPPPLRHLIRRRRAFLSTQDAPQATRPNGPRPSRILRWLAPYSGQMYLARNTSALCYLCHHGRLAPPLSRQCNRSRRSAHRTPARSLPSR
jgi:hypothetical protein